MSNKLNEKEVLYQFGYLIEKNIESTIKRTT